MACRLPYVWDLNVIAHHALMIVIAPHVVPGSRCRAPAGVPECTGKWLPVERSTS
jgi:hypothetical protein